MALTLKKGDFTLNGFFYCLAINFTYAGVKDTKEIGFFPWDLPAVKISPEWVTGPERGKSSGRLATFTYLWNTIEAGYNM